MLTDTQLYELADKMNIPLEEVIFKTECPDKFKFNKSYIFNLEDEYDEKGNLSRGTHWTCLQINKYPNGTIQCVYLDPYGCAPPEAIKKCYKRTTGKPSIPFCEKDIQSLMSNACGWYCCAYLHFVNNFSERTKDLYSDTENFLGMFDDLNKSVDFKKNEFILKHFFQPKDPSKRKAIEIIADPSAIYTDTNGEGLDAYGVNVNIMSNK